MTKRHAFLPIFVLTLAAAPTAASAFYQKTSLEGTVGSDLGGVWLVTHNVMPTFRVRLHRDPKNIAPFNVGPLPKDLGPVLGDKGKGVVISEFTDETASNRYGLLAGDVLTQVNTVPVGDVEEFSKALKDLTADWFLVTVRRPALKFSSLRLLKVRYDASETETDGITGISEKVEVRVLSASLPFQDEVEKARREGRLFVPSAAQIAGLKEKWFELPSPAQPVFMSGEHRVVGVSSYDSSLRQDKALEGSQFALVSTLQGNPMGGGGGKNVAIYGFEKVSADAASGSYVESTLATAPFPISIEFQGRFELIKIAPYSDKDVDVQAVRARDEAARRQVAEGKDLQIAPDVPANLPAAPKEQPAVAE